MNESSGLRSFTGLASHTDLEHAIAAFLQQKRREAMRGPLHSEVAFFAEDGHGWSTIVAELGPRSSLDGLLLWALNRAARILGAGAVACAEESYDAGSIVRIERRGARFGVTYFLPRDGNPPERDDAAFVAFEMLPGGSKTEGLGRQDHDSILIDPALLESRSGYGDSAAVHATLDSAIAAHAERVRARASDGPVPQQHAVFARASEGWITVVINAGWITDFITEVMWSTNRIARILGAVAVATTRSWDDEAWIRVERRGYAHCQLCPVLSDGELVMLTSDDYDTFEFLPGGSRTEGWGWAAHDSIDGERDMAPEGRGSPLRIADVTESPGPVAAVCEGEEG